MPTTDSEVLTSKQTAELLGISEGTLRQRRLRKLGPEYFKVGRAVRYDRVTVTDWIRKNTRAS